MPAAGAVWLLPDVQGGGVATPRSGPAVWTCRALALIITASAPPVVTTWAGRTTGSTSCSVDLQFSLSEGHGGKRAMRRGGGGAGQTAATLRAERQHSTRRGPATTTAALRAGAQGWLGGYARRSCANGVRGTSARWILSVTARAAAHEVHARLHSKRPPRERSHDALMHGRLGRSAAARPGCAPRDEAGAVLQHTARSAVWPVCSGGG